MVLEVALLTIKEGEEAAFEQAYRAGRDVLATTPGCLSVRMTRGVESPGKAVLLVEWESVEAHEQNFRGTERFVAWRGHVGSFFAAPPLVEHYADVAPTA